LFDARARCLEWIVIREGQSSEVLFRMKPRVLIPPPLWVLLFLALPACGGEDTPDPAHVEMIAVAGGSFRMGDINDYSPEENEKPAHEVAISPFRMSRTEITQAQWTAIMGANPAKHQGDNLPAENVTWFDAVSYCNKLSEREGLTVCYTGDLARDPQCDFKAGGYRLPTEAEWEYACRAGTTSEFYTGSTDADCARAAWYVGNAGGSTQAVGQKARNSFGLCDMSGNVVEWVWDRYDRTYYQYSPAADPTGPLGGTERVQRGGSYFVISFGCRSASRNMLAPKYKGYDLGFRVVRSGH
jgi:formylglycine-generating enzyme required for sulfatase activity